MKAVILAAGMGTRLGSTIPKPLTALENEKTILDFQIERLLDYFSINDIFVIVGYKKEMIMEKYPGLTYIYNHDYARTNTAKSLVLALKKINEDVLWLNGDVFFDKEVLSLLFRHEKSCMLTCNKECGEEEIKYKTDKDGYITELSKQVLSAQGEALGINLIKQKDIDLFIKQLEEVSDCDYFEKAIENMITKKGFKIKAVDVCDLFCVEIDFIEDLNLVKNMLIKNRVE